MTSIKENTINWDGFIFNIATAVYFLTLGPFVSNAVIQAQQAEQSMPILAIAIILLMFAESFALNKKLWGFVLRQTTIPDKSNLIIGILWFMHLILTLLMIAVISFLMGFEFSESSAQRDDFTKYTALALFIKEIVLLFKLPFRARVEKYKTVHKTIKNSNFGVYDIILFLFGCIAYSALLDTLIYNAEIDMERYLFQFFMFLIVFVLLYLPMRFAYIYEEFVSVSTIKSSFRSIGGFLLMLLSVYVSKFIFPLFWF